MVHDYLEHHRPDSSDNSFHIGISTGTFQFPVKKISALSVQSDLFRSLHIINMDERYRVNNSVDEDKWPDSSAI